MLPWYSGLRGSLFFVLAVLALPALAVGLDAGALALPANVTPEGVGFVAFLYVFREIHMRQSKLLELTIRQLSAPVAPSAAQEE